MFNSTFLDSVVIFGASGYIGYTLRQELESLEILVRSPSSIDIDLTNSFSVDQMTKYFSPTTAIIFSACISPDRGSNSKIFLDNIYMAYHLAEAIKKRAPAYLVYISANGVYEDNQSPCLESVLPAPQSLYGMMHLSREFILGQICRDVGIPMMVLRPGSVYGPLDLHNYYGPTRFLRTAVNNGYIELFGDGEELRDYVYIQDVVKVICLCLKKQTIGILNISSGQPKTFKEISNIIVRLLKNTIVVRSQPRPIGRNISNRYISNKKLLETFPELKFFSIEDGILQMLKDK